MKSTPHSSILLFILIITFCSRNANAQAPDMLHKYDLDVHLTGSVKQIVEQVYKVDKDGKKRSQPFGVRTLTYNEDGYLLSETLRSTDEEEGGYWTVTSYRYKYDKDYNLIREDETYQFESSVTEFRNRKVGETFYRIGKSDGTYTKTVHRYNYPAKAQLSEFIYYYDDTTKYRERIVYKWKGNKAYESLHYKITGELDYKTEYERDQWGKELEKREIDPASNQTKSSTSTRYQFNDTWTNWTKMYKTYKEPGRPDETLLFERHLEYYKNYDKPKRDDLLQYLSVKFVAGTGMDYWVSQEQDSFQVSRVAMFKSGDEITLDYFVRLSDDESYTYSYRFNPKDIVSIKEVPTRLTDKKVVQVELAKETYFSVRKSSSTGTTDLPKEYRKTLQLYVAPDIDVPALIKALEDLRLLW